MCWCVSVGCQFLEGYIGPISRTKERTMNDERTKAHFNHRRRENEADDVIGMGRRSTSKSKPSLVVLVKIMTDYACYLFLFPFSFFSLYPPFVSFVLFCMICLFCKGKKKRKLLNSKLFHRLTQEHHSRPDHPCRQYIIQMELKLLPDGEKGLSP